MGQYYLEVNIEDVGSFDENLADKLYKQPAEHLQIFEDAAKEVADELTNPRPEGEEKLEDIQIMLNSDAHPSNLRSLKVLLWPINRFRSVLMNYLISVGCCVQIGKNSWNSLKRFGNSCEGYETCNSMPIVQQCHPEFAGKTRFGGIYFA